MNGIDHCPTCKQPGHASETDDEGRHPQCTGDRPAFMPGTIVRVLPAYRQPMGAEPARYVADGCEGVYLVVGVRGQHRLLCLLRGEFDIPPIVAAFKRGEIDSSEWDVEVYEARLTEDLTRTTR